VIATPSIAVRSSASPVSARADSPAGKGVYTAVGNFDQAPNSFRELLQQSYGEPAAEESTSSPGSPKPEFTASCLTANPSIAGSASGSSVSARVAASAEMEANNAAGAFSRRSTSLIDLLRQSSAEPLNEESAPPSGSPNKESKQEKDAFDSPSLDAQTPAAPAGNPQIGLPVSPEIALASQARPERSIANQQGAMLLKGLPLPAAAIQEDFSIEWNNGRNPAASPADLAFALRLKPLASTDGTSSPVASSLLASPGPGTKSGEISGSSQGGLAATQPGNEAGADPQSGSDDSSRGNHAGAHRAAAPDQDAKTADPEKAQTPAPMEGATVRTQSEESQAAPLVHYATSPAMPEGPASSKAAAQPAPAPAATSLDLEDQLSAARPMRELSLQITSAGDQKVDVRLVERAGEVLVSVRTPDADLAHEMRQELGSLTGKLAQSGFGTEQFTPLSAGSSNLQDQRSTPENQDSSRGHGQDPQHGGSGQQQQPQDERGKRPAWLDEMENSLAQRQTNRSTAWLPNR